MSLEGPQKKSTTRGDDPRRRGSRNLMRHAREVADYGDRWFVSCGQALSDVGKQTRAAGALIGESAAAALQTTAGVARTLSDRAGLRPRAKAMPAPRPEEKLEVLSAIAADRAEGEEAPSQDCDGTPATIAMPEGSVLTAERAGVLPMWRALGRVVSQHSGSGYRSLEGDERFWELLGLIREHTPPELERNAQYGCGDPAMPPRSSMPTSPAMPPAMPPASIDPEFTAAKPDSRQPQHPTSGER